METAIAEDKILTAAEMKLVRANCLKSLPAMGTKEFQPTGSLLESKQIHATLEERQSLLEEKKVEKLNLLVRAEWLPDRKQALVTRRAGKHFEVMGYEEGLKLMLNAEEILYLLEMKCAELYLGGVPLSVQQGHCLLLAPGTGCSLIEYAVYKHLFRLGYRVRRHDPAAVPTQYELDLRLNQYGGRRAQAIQDGSTNRRLSSSEVIREQDVIRVDRMPTILMEEDPAAEGEDIPGEVENVLREAEDMSVEGDSARGEGEEMSEEEEDAPAEGEDVPRDGVGRRAEGTSPPPSLLDNGMNVTEAATTVGVDEKAVPSEAEGTNVAVVADTAPSDGGPICTASVAIASAEQIRAVFDGKVNSFSSEREAGGLPTASPASTQPGLSSACEETGQEGTAAAGDAKGTKDPEGKEDASATTPEGGPEGGDEVSNATEEPPWASDANEDLFCEDVVPDNENWYALEDDRKPEEASPPPRAVMTGDEDDSEIIGLTLDKKDEEDEDDDEMIGLILDKEEEEEEEEENDESALPMGALLSDEEDIEDLASPMAMAPPGKVAPPIVEAMKDVDTGRKRFEPYWNQRMSGVNTVLNGAATAPKSTPEVVDLDSTAESVDEEATGVSDEDVDEDSMGASPVNVRKRTSGKTGPGIADLDSGTVPSEESENVRAVPVISETVPATAPHVASAEDTPVPKIVESTGGLPPEIETSSPPGPDIVPAEDSTVPEIVESAGGLPPDVETSSPVTSVTDSTVPAIVESAGGLPPVRETSSPVTSATRELIADGTSVVVVGKTDVVTGGDSTSGIFRERDSVGSSEVSVPRVVSGDSAVSLPKTAGSDVATGRVLPVGKVLENVKRDNLSRVLESVPEQSSVIIKLKQEDCNLESDFQVVMGENNCPILIDMTSVKMNRSVSAKKSKDIEVGIVGAGLESERSQSTGGKRSSEASAEKQIAKKSRMDVLNVEGMDDSDVVETAEEMDKELLETNADGFTEPNGIDSRDFLEGLVLNATDEPASAGELATDAPEVAPATVAVDVEEDGTDEEDSDFVDLDLDADVEDMASSDSEESDIEVVDLESDSDVEVIPVESGKRKRADDANAAGLPAAKRTAPVTLVNLSDDDSGDDEEEVEDDDDIVEAVPSATKKKHWSPELYLDKQRVDILKSLPNAFNKMEVVVDIPEGVMPPNCHPTRKKVVKLWNLDAVGMGGKPTRDWKPAHERIQQMERSRQETFISLDHNASGPSQQDSWPAYGPNGRPYPPPGPDYEHQFGQIGYPFPPQSPFPFGVPQPFGQPPFNQRMNVYGDGLLPMPHMGPNMNGPNPGLLPQFPWQQNNPFNSFSPPNAGPHPGNNFGHNFGNEFSLFRPIMTPRMPNKTLHGVRHVPKPQHDPHQYRPQGWFQQNNWYKGPNKRQVECRPRVKNNFDTKGGIVRVKAEAGGANVGATHIRWDQTGACKVERVGATGTGGGVAVKAEQPDAKPNVLSLSQQFENFRRATLGLGPSADSMPPGSLIQRGLSKRQRRLQRKRLRMEEARVAAANVAVVKVEKVVEVSPEVAAIDVSPVDVTPVDATPASLPLVAGENRIAAEVVPALAELRRVVESEMSDPAECVPVSDSSVHKVSDPVEESETAQDTSDVGEIRPTKNSKFSIHELKLKASLRHASIGKYKDKIRTAFCELQRCAAVSSIEHGTSYKLQVYLSRRHPGMGVADEEFEEFLIEDSRSGGASGKSVESTDDDGEPQVFDVNEEEDDSDCRVIEESGDRSSDVDGGAADVDEGAEDIDEGVADVDGGVEDDDVVPLLRPTDCTDFGSILSRIDIIKPAAAASESGEVDDPPKISFDLYNPPVDKKTAAFRKTDPGIPDFRVVIMSIKDSRANTRQLAAVCRQHPDGVPILFAFVHHPVVGFMRFDNVSLPPDLEDYGLP